MTDKEDMAQQILDTALNLAESNTWEKLRLFEVAAELGISLDDIRRHYAQKDDLVDTWFDRADQAMLEFADQEALRDLSVRERFSLVLMAWLDALAPHRRVTGDMLLYKLEPAHIHLQVGGLLRISRTVQWLREAVGRDSSHLYRIAEEVASTGIFVATFVYWLGDDSAGSARTRAFLERQLDRAERLAWLLPGGSQ